MMHALTLLALAALSSSAPATPRATTSWQDAVVATMAKADPIGGWKRVAVARPDAQAEHIREGTVTIRKAGAETSATYNGNITLKRGVVAATSPDGKRALLVAQHVIVCDTGCKPYEGMRAGDVDTRSERESCVHPLCGGNLSVLTRAAPAYLAADIVTQRDGSKAFVVRGLVVGFQIAFKGIEPDEID
jgi:hypothetical protein